MLDLVKKKLSKIHDNQIIILNKVRKEKLSHFNNNNSNNNNNNAKLPKQGKFLPSFLFAFVVQASSCICFRTFLRYFSCCRTTQLHSYCYYSVILSLSLSLYLIPKKTRDTHSLTLQLTHTHTLTL